ncbi:MAG TPA: NAD(+) synthase [Ruminococcaceae bacterium]|nr:NAD(+) synthase [Oscillospiraceae bacterium]
MRDYKLETEKRVDFIRRMLGDSGADGIVFGNSGGKDCALVGILCRRACDKLLAVMMPCGSTRNYGEDIAHAKLLADKFSIPYLIMDLAPAQNALTSAISVSQPVTAEAAANIAPRLRMTALYTIAGSRNSLVAGTGNKSERSMGYFTKWGDGACDFNPIGDLTVTEVYEFLRFLGTPREIIEKAPSAGLFEGQTDEREMGISYAAIDDYLLTGNVNEKDFSKIERAYKKSEHKRRMPVIYGEDD